MEHNITTQIRTLFPNADAEYMSDRLRAAGITTLLNPDVDVVIVNRIRLNAEHVADTGKSWTPNW